MRYRRCFAVLLQPKEQLEFDLESLLLGNAPLMSKRSWLALAAHLPAPTEVDQSGAMLMGSLGETLWTEAAELGPDVAETLAALVRCGLVLPEDPELAAGAFRVDAAMLLDHVARDERVRQQHWSPLSAIAHAHSRWTGVDAQDAARESGYSSIRDMVQKLGPAPSQFHARVAPPQRQALPAPETTPMDTLLRRRITCRNFDSERAVDQALLARVLHRVFGAQAQWEAAPDSFVVKKTSPSGGGLHATEAYVIVRNVEGVAPGLYHYHAGDHALEPIDLAEPETLGDRALGFVAGQYWFSGAPVQVVLAPRFKRSFWKYRNHAKAYRALILDAGHLSQTLYLTATELGLGAFITSAINEVEIERAFGLDPLEEGPLAVCGFGYRADTRETVEFDPLNAVWPAEADTPT